MKTDPPYMVWNASAELTGCGRRAASGDGAAALKRLRRELGAGFDRAFRLRMITARAATLEQLLEDWVHERTQLGV